MRLPRAKKLRVSEDVVRLRAVPEMLGPDSSDLLGRIRVVPEKNFEALYRFGAFRETRTH